MLTKAGPRVRSRLRRAGRPDPMARAVAVTARAWVPTPPSGRQFTLRHGAQEVVVTEVGGGLLTLQPGERHDAEWGLHSSGIGRPG